MPADPEHLFDIQQLVLDMGEVDRNHQLPGTSQPENVIMHSITVTMMVWYLHDRLELKDELSLEECLRSAISHDFLERGLKRDTNAYASPTDRVIKAERERREMEKFKADFPYFPGLIETMETYEERQTPESVFVKSVDRIQSIILAIQNNWQPYMTAKEGGISYAEYRAETTRWLNESSPYLLELFIDIAERGRQYYVGHPDFRVEDALQPDNR